MGAANGSIHNTIVGNLKRPPDANFRTIFRDSSDGNYYGLLFDGTVELIGGSNAFSSVVYSAINGNMLNADPNQDITQDSYADGIIADVSSPPLTAGTYVVWHESVFQKTTPDDDWAFRYALFQDDDIVGASERYNFSPGGVGTENWSYSISVNTLVTVTEGQVINPRYRLENAGDSTIRVLQTSMGYMRIA